MMTWTYDPDALGRILEAMGFDLDSGRDVVHDGALTGRQERAGRATVVTVDAGGRVRVTVTVMMNDQRRAPIHAGSAEFQVTSESIRTSIASGVLTETWAFREAIAAIITGLVELDHDHLEHRTTSQWPQPGPDR